MRNKLIDKDALIAWIESQIDSLERNSGCSGIFGEYQMAVYDKLLSFLDTLEVKEVDDEKCKEYDKALSIAKAWYKSSDSSAQERNVAHMIMGDKVREEL